MITTSLFLRHHSNPYPNTPAHPYYPAKRHRRASALSVTEPTTLQQIERQLALLLEGGHQGDPRRTVDRDRVDDRDRDVELLAVQRPRYQEHRPRWRRDHRGGNERRGPRSRSPARRHVQDDTRRRWRNRSPPRKRGPDQGRDRRDRGGADSTTPRQPERRRRVPNGWEKATVCPYTARDERCPNPTCPFIHERGLCYKFLKGICSLPARECRFKHQ